MAWQHCSDSTTQQILQATTAEFVGKATSIDEQLPTLYQEQEKLADQISVIEECIEDYLASKLKAILYGLAYNYTRSARQSEGLIPKYERFAGEWKVDEIYPYNPAQTFVNFVSLTDEESPFTYNYYISLVTHTASGETKPPNPTYWLPLTIEIYPPYSSVDGEFWVELLGGYNSKVYGKTLSSDWSIHVSDIIDPSTGLPRPIPEYPLAYAYESGPFWGADVKVDTQVIESVGEWDPSNDLVTRPFLEDAFYGLKAKYDNVGKAIDYLQNTKNKYIAMVPLLGKFIK